MRSEPNAYFAHLDQEQAGSLTGIVGREHTGQVATEDRVEHEAEFREGRLAALFCSPTMELGVDIADLAVLHLRNVPPTPANYAQRGGRAGRGGRPALVMTFCSQGNSHDQYFFRHKDRMIAGAVSPPRIDLLNRELVRAHLHSLWLSRTGLDLQRSVADLLDLDDEPTFPLYPERLAQLTPSPVAQSAVLDAFREVAVGIELRDG